MGKALAEAFPAARAVLMRSMPRSSEKLTAVIWDGPGRDPAAHRERPAGIDGVRSQPCVAGDRSRLLGGARRRVVADIRSANIRARGRRSLSISDTARLLRIRGLAMQKAGAGGLSRDGCVTRYGL